MKLETSRQVLVWQAARRFPEWRTIEIDGEVLLDKGADGWQEALRQYEQTYHEVERRARRAVNPESWAGKSAAWVLDAIPRLSHLLEQGLHTPIAYVEEQGHNVESARPMDRLARQAGGLARSATAACQAVWHDASQSRWINSMRHLSARVHASPVGRAGAWAAAKVVQAAKAEPEISFNQHRLKVDGTQGTICETDQARVFDVPFNLWNLRVTAAAFGLGANPTTPGSGFPAFAVSGAGRLAAAAVWGLAGDRRNAVQAGLTGARDAALSALVGGPVVPFLDQGLAAMSLASIPYAPVVDPIMGAGVARTGHSAGRLLQGAQVADIAGVPPPNDIAVSGPELAAHAIVQLFTRGHVVAPATLRTFFGMARDDAGAPDAPRLDRALAAVLEQQHHGPAAQRLCLAETFALARVLRALPEALVPASSAAVCALLARRVSQHQAADRPPDLEALSQAFDRAVASGQVERWDQDLAARLAQHLDRAPGHRMRARQAHRLVTFLKALGSAPRALQQARALSARLDRDAEAFHAIATSPSWRALLGAPGNRLERWLHLGADAKVPRSVHHLEALELPAPTVDSAEAWAERLGNDPWPLVAEWARALMAAPPRAVGAGEPNSG